MEADTRWKNVEQIRSGPDTIVNIFLKHEIPFYCIKTQCSSIFQHDHKYDQTWSLNKCNIDWMITGRRGLGRAVYIVVCLNGWMGLDYMSMDNEYIRPS